MTIESSRRPPVGRLGTLSGIAAAAVILGLGCSSSPGSGTGGSSGGGSGGGGGGGGASAALYQPCGADQRAGVFAVQLKPTQFGADPYTNVNGGVLSGTKPSAWQEVSKQGDCRFVMGRTCATACTNGQICGTAGTCIAEPTGQDVGTVSVTGLGPTHMLMANPVNRTYDLSITKSNFPQVPYPPFAPGAEVRLSAAGGAYSPFTLTGRGITPMQFSGTGVNVRRDNPVAITWTTPPQPEAARVLLEMDIAHHGGIAARIECDLADTGSVTIPATLITQLIERGTAGFPVITLTRLTLTSTTIQPGCVEFAVASPLEQDITVEGVTSCSGDRPCPDNRECGPDLKCLP